MAQRAEPNEGFSELVSEFEQLAELVPAATRKLVFGSPSCLLGGHLFFGCHPIGLFIRLSAESGAELIAAGGSPFEPMPERPMTGFYVLGSDTADHASWVLRAYEQAGLLEPKQPSAPTTRTESSGGTESSGAPDPAARKVPTPRRPARLTNDPPQR